MLILTRKLGESVMIDGRIKVKVIRLDGDAVRIGFEAPPDVPIHRHEIYAEIQDSNTAALNQGKPALPKLAAPTKTPLSSAANTSGKGDK